MFVSLSGCLAHAFCARRTGATYCLSSRDLYIYPSAGELAFLVVGCIQQEGQGGLCWKGRAGGVAGSSSWDVQIRGAGLPRHTARIYRNHSTVMYPGSQRDTFRPLLAGRFVFLCCSLARDDSSTACGGCGLPGGAINVCNDG